MGNVIEQLQFTINTNYMSDDGFDYFTSSLALMQSMNEIIDSYSNGDPDQNDESIQHMLMDIDFTEYACDGIADEIYTFLQYVDCYDPDKCEFTNVGSLPQQSNDGICIKCNGKIKHYHPVCEICCDEIIDGNPRRSNNGEHNDK